MKTLNLRNSSILFDLMAFDSNKSFTIVFNFAISSSSSLTSIFEISGNPLVIIVVRVFILDPVLNMHNIHNYCRSFGAVILTIF